MGFLSPASRGALMTTSMVCYFLLGAPSGYFSARFYKMFGGEKWAMNVIATALLCPGYLSFKTKFCLFLMIFRIFKFGIRIIFCVEFSSMG